MPILTRKSNQVNQIIEKVNNLLIRFGITNGFYYISNEMIDQRMLWKDGIHLSDDGIKMWAGTFSKNWSIFLRNDIELILLWILTILGPRFWTDNQIRFILEVLILKEANNNSLSNAGNKTIKKLFCTGTIKRTDCLSMLKTNSSKNTSNIIQENVNMNSFPNKFRDLKVLLTRMVDILILRET